MSPEQSAPPTKVLHHGRRRGEYDQEIQAAGGGATLAELLPTRDEKDALAGTSGHPAKANKYATHADSRLSDQRDAKSLQSRTVAATAPTDGQALKWTAASGQWEPGTIAGGGGGGAGVTQLHAVRVTKSAVQALTTGVLTALIFDQEDYDVGGLHDNVTNNTRIAFQRAGKYKITGHVVFSANATGLRAVRIRKNGATNIALTEVAAASGESTALPVTTELDVIAGDYVELIGYQTSGGNLNVVTAETAFMAFEIALAAPWKTRNLIVENGATPASQVKITADEITVEDIVVASVSVTADITASGANGLDTGVEAASTWYAVWLIFNPSSGAVASLLSTSFTAPTMPAGYTKKRRVSAIRNDPGSNFYKILQLGDFVHYVDPVMDINNHRVINGGTATVFTAVTGATRTVPTTSRRMWIRSGIASGAVAGLMVRITGSGAVNGVQVGIRNGTVDVQINAWVDLNTGQSFDYMFTAAGVGGAYMDVMGYIDPVL